MTTDIPLTETLRALARDLAAPNADVLALARELTALADRVDAGRVLLHSRYGTVLGPEPMIEHGRPSPAGTDRLWKER